jgi:hypothetical protein
VVAHLHVLAIVHHQDVHHLLEAGIREAPIRAQEEAVAMIEQAQPAMSLMAAE